MARRRRKNASYLVNFLLAATAVIAILYVGKSTASPPPSLPE